MNYFDYISEDLIYIICTYLPRNSKILGTYKVFEKVYDKYLDDFINGYIKPFKCYKLNNLKLYKYNINAKLITTLKKYNYELSSRSYTEAAMNMFKNLNIKCIYYYEHISISDYDNEMWIIYLDNKNYYCIYKEEEIDYEDVVTNNQYDKWKKLWDTLDNKIKSKLYKQNDLE